jgi:hypothetical protein
MKSFKTYSGEKGAKKYAGDLVKDLAKQNSVGRVYIYRLNKPCRQFSCSGVR